MSITAGFISEILKNVMNPDFSDNNTILSEFSLTKPLPIKLEFYVEHFLYQSNCPEELIVLAYIIIQDLAVKVDQYNIHKLLFTALSLSYKFTTDNPASNSELEKIGVLKTGELGNLEIIMLEAINWNIQHNNYDSVLKQLQDAGIPEIQLSKSTSEDEVLSDFAGYETSDSFSELSAFFSSEN